MGNVLDRLEISSFQHYPVKHVRDNLMGPVLSLDPLGKLSFGVDRGKAGQAVDALAFPYFDGY